MGRASFRCRGSYWRTKCRDCRNRNGGTLLTTGVAQLYYSMQASYQMLDLLQQTHDVIDYAVKAHQSKVAHGLEAKVPYHGARAQLLAVDKQIVAVEGQIKRNSGITPGTDRCRRKRSA